MPTLRYLRTTDRATPAPGAGAVPTVLLDTLADQNLRRTWDDEWRRRRLHDPAPLPVSWVNADELADRWENITGADDRTRTLDGSLADLADVFRAVPSQRLVLVGPAGQGKSVLCLHLARELLDRRRPGGPVPVLLMLATWDPRTTALADWLAEWLPIDLSPVLGEPDGHGQTVARSMVDGSLVVPILDGLDPPGTFPCGTAALLERPYNNSSCCGSVSSRGRGTG